MTRQLYALALVLLAWGGLGCASRRVDLLESGEAVLYVRSKKKRKNPTKRARAATEKAIAPEQFLDERVRDGFAASLGSALGVNPAAVLVGQNPVAFPLPMPEGFQVATGYQFEPPRVELEGDAIRVRCSITVAMALLDVPAPERGTYDALAVWAAQAYLARSLQDAGFRLSEASAARLAAPPFEPGQD